MKPPFQKDRKLDLSTLEDWPRKAREDKAAGGCEDGKEAGAEGETKTEKSRPDFLQQAQPARTKGEG